MVHHQLVTFVYASASPPVHMAQMWGVCVLLIRLDVCCQSASRPSIYCKSCSVFKAKRNKHSVSQPKPQQHKRRPCQQGPLAKCKLAALCVQQADLPRCLEFRQTPVLSKPRLTNQGSCSFPSQTLLILLLFYRNPFFPPTFHPLPAATGPGYCSHRHGTVHGKQ